MATGMLRPEDFRPAVGQIGGKFVSVSVWLPTDPPRPAPPVLIPEEVILLLRIEASNPRETLRRYQRAGRLRGFRVGRRVRYLLEDVMQMARDMREGLR